MGQPIDTASVLIVPELSGFARQLKSEVDQAMRQLTSQLDRAFAGIERGAADAGGEVGTAFQRGGERGEDAFRELSRTARTEFAEINASADRSAAGISAKLGGALSLVKTGLLAAGVGAGVALAGITAFGLKSAASLEQSTVAFTSLLHSGEAATEFLGELQQFAACVDTATQAFTHDGWRSYEDLSVGQQILTINPATGRSEWQPIEALHAYEGHHEMLRISGQHHDSVSTLNHRWPIYARGQHRHRILFATSETLDPADQLIGAASGQAPIEAAHSDEFVELVAWFWTEGSIHPPSQDLDASAARVTIRQSMRANPRKCARIETALTKEFGQPGRGNWGVTGPDADGGMQWRLARPQAKRVVAAAPNRVPTMEFLRSLTAEQLDLFIAISLEGDGHVRPRTGQMNLTQKRREQAERFADAVSLSGRRCRLYEAENGRRWVVSIYRMSALIGMSHARRSEVSFSRETLRGIVWCPQVRNGTWFAQRNGHRYFTGNSTPFEFKDVVPASQRLLVLAGALGQTQAAVIPMLTTIGDLVSVTGGSAESIDSVVRALGQMASKGKISQEELMQLSEALPGFNANAAIAGSLGLSVADTLTLISAGGVDATTGINALLTGMAQFPGAAGAMAAQAQTLTGVFSTFKDTIGIALTNAFQPVIPEIKSALSDLTPVLGSAIGQLAPSLGRALSGILPILGKLIEAIVPILMPILDALGPVLDALGPSLVPLGEAIGQLVVALAPVLPVLAQFIAVLAQLAIPIIKLLAAVLIPLTPVLNYMALAIGEVAKALGMIDWTAVGAAIGGAFATAWHAVSDFVVGVAQAIFGFGEMVGTWVRGFLDRVAAMITELINFIQGLPGQILQALGDFGSLLYSKGKDLILGLWNGIKDMGGWLWSQVTGFVNNFLTGPIKAALGIHSPSTVARDEIGAMYAAGIGEGLQMGIPGIQSLIAGITPGASGAQSGTAMNFGGINVTINFVGGTPTTAEASAVGQAAGDGIMQAIARRNVGLAVSMGVSQ